MNPNEQPTPEYNQPSPHSEQNFIPQESSKIITDSSPYGQAPAVVDTSKQALQNQSVASQMPSDYASNPFIATARGLAQTLRINPVSTMTLGLLVILAFLILIGLMAAFSAALPDAGRVIAIFATFVIMGLLLVKTYAASTIIHLRSQAGETITGHHAIGRLSNHRFGTILGVAMLSGIAVLFGLGFFLIPGIIIGARLALAPFAVYAENLGVIDALKRSWNITRGHTLEMIGASFAQIITVGSSGGLLSLVGSQAAFANRYEELKAAEQAQLSTGKPHWMNLGVVVFMALFLIGYFALIGYSFYQGMKQGFDNDSKGPISSGQTYCYTAAAAEYSTTCVDEVKCQAVTACSDLYFSETNRPLNSTELQ